MNWPFLLLMLLGAALPLGMIAWILLLAPTGDPASDRERDGRRAALAARLRSMRDTVVQTARRPEPGKTP